MKFLLSFCKIRKARKRIGPKNKPPGKNKPPQRLSFLNQGVATLSGWSSQELRPLNQSCPNPPKNADRNGTLALTRKEENKFPFKSREEQRHNRNLAISSAHARTSMLLTAGLFSRLRWRCILASGDLAAAAAPHERHITAASRHATTRAAAMAPFSLSLTPPPLFLLRSPSRPPPRSGVRPKLQERRTPSRTRDAPARRRPTAALPPGTGLRILKQCGGCGVERSGGTLSGGSPSGLGD